MVIELMIEKPIFRMILTKWLHNLLKHTARILLSRSILNRQVRKLGQNYVEYGSLGHFTLWVRPFRSKHRHRQGTSDLATCTKNLKDNFI